MTKNDVSGVRLTENLRPGNEARATKVLQHYFAPMAAHAGFTGGQWDTFDPSGTRSTSGDVFTADDVAACALLSVPLQSRAVWELLAGPRRDELTAWLCKLPADVDLVDIEPGGDEYRAMLGLYDALRSIPTLGQARITKLMARKRPRLVAIVDSVVLKEAFGNGTKHWEPLRAALAHDDRALHRRLLALRDEAGLGEEISALRVFDALTWMDGTGQSRYALEGKPMPEAKEAKEPAVTP